jgi:hypothetical protein
MINNEQVIETNFLSLETFVNDSSKLLIDISKPAYNKMKLKILTGEGIFPQNVNVT